MTTPALYHDSQPALKCFGVIRACLPGYWAEAWTLLEPAVALNGLYTRKSILEALVDGQMQLWVGETDVMDIAAITEVSVYPLRKIATVVFIGGERLDRALPFLETLEAWAWENGCDRFICNGRPGFQKRLERRGYRLSLVTLVKDHLHG